MARSIDNHAGATNYGNIDYYDILVIGKTGMGKSTTSDKLVIANPRRINYIGEQHCDDKKQGSCVHMSDLSIWVIAESEKDHCIKRLKNLVMFRGLSEPHREVNDFYNTSTDQTVKPQLISNESTWVRVLDVPGFFGSSSESGLETTAKEVTTAGLGIMREILQIQATMQMNFKRIVYFLPERGPLERAHKVLQMELEVMVHYFGKSIFDCMTLIATVSPDVYKYIPPDTTPFSDDARRKTRHYFQETLSRVLPKDECPSNDKPPIIFISMHDTCEDVLRKIKDAPVITDEITLEFHHETCIRCGLKAKVIGEGERKVKVACYAGQDLSQSIPYEESLCHPMIIPKYWKITKILGGIAHFITRNKYAGQWCDFNNPDDEICVDCRKVPGTRGCMMVNTEYKYKGEMFKIDHKCGSTN